MNKSLKLRAAAVLSLAIVGARAAPARAVLLADGQATTNPAPASAPAAPAPPPGATVLQVTVAEVHGNVQVRGGDDQPWQPAKAGMVVNEGAEFRTGPRSSVRCTIPPDQSFTLDRLGTVKVLQALRDGNKLHTDMVMKYGRTKYSVEAAGLEHEGTIASPSGTLAVRGTVVSLYDQPPFVPEAASYTGQARFRDAHRQLSVGSKGGGLVTVQGDKDSAADTALSAGVTDPKYAGARTSAESDLIANQVARGGVVSFDPIARITVITNATPISNDAELAHSLPGKLNFVARWFGPADVNLSVFTEFGNPTTLLFSGKTFEPDEFLYPGYGLNHSKSGGTIAFDNRGGPTGGTEIAFWQNPPKEAVYGLSANHISGAPVEVKLNAFLNGQKQSLFYLDAQGNFLRTKTIDVTLSDTQFQTGLVFIPAVDILEQIPATGDDGSNPAGTGTGGTTTTTTAAAATKTPTVASRSTAAAGPKTVSKPQATGAATTGGARGRNR
jgi:hypothetical protein